MNILNGKSTGRRLVMIVENEYRRSNGTHPIHNNITGS